MFNLFSSYTRSFELQVLTISFLVARCVECRSSAASTINYFSKLVIYEKGLYYTGLFKVTMFIWNSLQFINTIDVLAPCWPLIELYFGIEFNKEAFLSLLDIAYE